MEESAVKVSMMIATRKRINKLNESVDSLLNNLSDENEIEFLFGVDNDDMETVNFIVSTYPQSKILLVPRWGYQGFHEYVNRMAAIAEGDWLFLWNDDCVMQTKDWDKQIASFGGKFVTLAPLTSNYNYEYVEANLFPITPKEWYNLLGHWSLSPQNDSWVQHVSTRVGIQRHVDIKIAHNQDTSDETGKEIQYGVPPVPAMDSLINRDVETIKGFLKL